MEDLYISMPVENEYTAFGSDTSTLLSALIAHPRGCHSAQTSIIPPVTLPWEHFMGGPLYA
jgi:hypothetical protein